MMYSPFSALMRAEALREETFPLMKLAGIAVISLGLESSSPEILAAMRKVGAGRENAYLERMKWAVAAAKQEGITAQCSMMVGFPGETEEQGRATIEFVREAGFDRYDHIFFEAVPGSEVQRRPELFGIAVAPVRGGWVPDHGPKKYDMTRVPFGENCENRSILAAYYLIRALRLLSANVERG